MHLILNHTFKVMLKLFNMVKRFIIASAIHFIDVSIIHLLYEPTFPKSLTQLNYLLGCQIIYIFFFY